MSKNSVFRQAALDRLASPEQLDTLMRIVDAKGWLALLGCALIMATAVVWAIFGSIQTKISASGILLTGGALEEISASADGQVVSIQVKAGDEVKKGQLVALFSQPALKQEIETLEQRLTEIGSSRDGGANDAADDAIRAMHDAQRQRLRGRIARLEKQLKDGSRVVSSLDGHVVEVRAVAGDRLARGTPIVAIERSGERIELDALLYFDSHQGKALKPGMPIELVPSVVRKERHGVLLGKVKSVEVFPSTRLGMMGALRNEQLVETFIQEAGGAPIAVRAELLEDTSTPSGYRWSSGEGPSVVLTSGTRVQAAVITRTRRPIALVFPALDDGG